MKRRSFGFEELQWHDLFLGISHCCRVSRARLMEPTFALLASPVYTYACDQHVVDDCEAALAAYPLATFSSNPCILKHGCLVEEHTSAMYGPGKWNFVRVEVIEDRFSSDFAGLISKNFND